MKASSVKVASRSQQIAIIPVSSRRRVVREATFVAAATIPPVGGVGQRLLQT